MPLLKSLLCTYSHSKDSSKTCLDATNTSARTQQPLLQSLAEASALRDEVRRGTLGHLRQRRQGLAHKQQSCAFCRPRQDRGEGSLPGGGQVAGACCTCIPRRVFPRGRLLQPPRRLLRPPTFHPSGGFALFVRTSPRWIVADPALS